MLLFSPYRKRNKPGNCFFIIAVSFAVFFFKFFFFKANPNKCINCNDYIRNQQRPIRIDHPESPDKKKCSQIKRVSQKMVNAVYQQFLFCLGVLKRLIKPLRLKKYFLIQMIIMLEPLPAIITPTMVIIERCEKRRGEEMLN